LVVGLKGVFEEVALKKTLHEAHGRVEIWLQGSPKRVSAGTKERGSRAKIAVLSWTEDKLYPIKGPLVLAFKNKINYLHIKSSCS
jgi:hypothetical protein